MNHKPWTETTSVDTRPASLFCRTYSCNNARCVVTSSYRGNGAGSSSASGKLPVRNWRWTINQVNIVKETAMVATKQLISTKGSRTEYLPACPIQPRWLLVWFNCQQTSTQTTEDDAKVGWVAVLFVQFICLSLPLSYTFGSTALFSFLVAVLRDNLRADGYRHAAARHHIIFIHGRENHGLEPRWHCRYLHHKHWKKKAEAEGKQGNRIKGLVKV